MSLLTRKSEPLGKPVLGKNRAEIPWESAGVALSQATRNVPAADPAATPATAGTRFLQVSHLLTLKAVPLADGTARATPGRRARAEIERMRACLAFIGVKPRFRRFCCASVVAL